MPLSPPSYFRKTRGIIRIGAAASRPAAADVLPGTLYYSTDTRVIERSNGTTWDEYGDLSNVAHTDVNETFDFDVTVTGSTITTDLGATGTTVLVDTTISDLDVTSNFDLTCGSIIFPALQIPYVNPNALDDYEEGTWTPVIGGSGGTSGQTYSVQVGIYTKIGRFVIVQYSVVLTNAGTITGNVQIQGLPFPVANIVGYFPVCSLGQFNNLATNWITLTVVGTNGLSDWYVRGSSAAATSNATPLTAADISNATNFFGTIVYNTDT